MSFKDEERSNGIIDVNKIFRKASDTDFNEHIEQIKQWTLEERVNAGRNTFVEIIKQFQFLWDDEPTAFVRPLINFIGLATELGCAGLENVSESKKNEIVNYFQDWGAIKNAVLKQDAYFNYKALDDDGYQTLVEIYLCASLQPFAPSGAHYTNLLFTYMLLVACADQVNENGIKAVRKLREDYFDFALKKKNGLVDRFTGTLDNPELAAKLAEEERNEEKERTEQKKKETDDQKARPESAPAPVNEPAPVRYANVCMQCGTPREADNLFCKNCGASLQLIVPAAQPAVSPEFPAPSMMAAQAPVQPAPQPVPQPMPVQEQVPPVTGPAGPAYAQPTPGINPTFEAAPANLKEFVLRFCDDKTQKTLKTSGIILYVYAAINLVFALMEGILSIDAIIFVGLGYWFSKSYSNKCAIAVLTYAILSMVLSLVYNGTLSGWLILILGVVLFTTTSKAQKAFDAYQSNGQIPMQ